MNKANAFATGAKLLSAVPAFLAGLSMLSSQATGQDMSNGADNFYKSDKVDRREGHLQEPVPDEHRGESVRPQGLESGREASRHRRRASDGCGEGAECQPLRHQDGRAGIRRPVPGFALLGRERGASLATSCRPTSTRRASVPPWTSWALNRSSTRDESGPSGFAAAGASSSVPPKSTRDLKAIATVSMYDMGAANRHSLKKSHDARTAEEGHRRGRGPARRRVRGRRDQVHERVRARAFRKLPPHRAGVLRLLSHASRRVHAERQLARTDHASDA